MKDKVNIKDIIQAAGKQLRSSFDFTSSTSTHAATQGQEGEDTLIDFLNERLPKRFKASSGFIIDGQGNNSNQCDVIVYDALNSPIYKPGEKEMIIVNDNAACVIEVKSTLNKNSLTEAAENIEAAKKLVKSPITNIDQEVNKSDFVNTRTYGIVFAYRSDTTLKTLAKNLKEINEKIESSNWIDLVVVLDKGVVGYMIQEPFNAGKLHWFGGAGDSEFPPPPYYIQLAISELGDLTLNKFFVSLLSHLTFYRKRIGFDLDSLMGKEGKEAMVISSYQYDTSRNLKDLTDDHLSENFTMPYRYNLFQEKDKRFLGQVSLKPWQDGAMLSYSGFFRPDLIFETFLKGKEYVVLSGLNQNHYISTIVKLSVDDFESIASSISDHIKVIVSEKDEDDGDVSTAIKYRGKK